MRDPCGNAAIGGLLHPRANVPVGSRNTGGGGRPGAEHSEYGCRGQLHGRVPRTAVIDRVRALALIVVYNSMAHTKRASYARPARESANIRTTVPLERESSLRTPPCSLSPGHQFGTALLPWPKQLS